MASEQSRDMTSEQILILTEKELIEGTFFHHRNIRLSDALNGPGHRDNPYVPLADAIVTSRETGQELLQTRFLLVSHSQIIGMLPKPEMVSCPMIRPWVRAAEEKAK
jgi:hypothetical protein